MNHSAFDLQQAIRRHAQGLLQACSLETGSFRHFLLISTRLIGTCFGMAGRTECSDSQYPSTCHDLLHQTICAGFRTVSLVSVQNLGSCLQSTPAPPMLSFIDALLRVQAQCTTFFRQNFHKSVILLRGGMSILSHAICRQIRDHDPPHTMHFRFYL